jgi:hypothetical protein
VGRWGTALARPSARSSAPRIVWNNLNYQTVRTNFDTFGGEMAKQQKYPEVYRILVSEGGRSSRR